MKRFLLALVLALPLLGGQGLQRATGDAMSFTPPDTAPWTALGAHRVEIVATITSCDSTSTFWKVGGLHAYCSSGNNVWLTSPGDSGSESIAGMTDVLIRIQRDPAQTLDSSNAGAPVAHLEMWNADGSGRIYQRTNDNSSTIDASSLQTWSVGTGDIEFHSIKVFSDLVEVGANSPLPDPHAVGDLANWDFEGVATDSGPSSMTFATTGTNYVTTPALNPVADPAVDADAYWMQQPSIRAGASVALSSSRSISYNDDESLLCLWTYEGGGTGPAAFRIASPSSCETTGIGPTFGTYEDVCLEVTDQAANTHKTCLDVGAVATDDNRIVVMDDDRFAFALGENIQWSKSAWPYIPDRAYKMAKTFIDSRTAATWRTLGTGTISVTLGSNVVTGSGTDLQDDYCSGGTVPNDSAKLIVLDDNGIYWPWNITSCDSATQLTMSANWNKASDSGLSYSFWTSAQSSPWINGSENENYYDNVWAYYWLCKTSGFQLFCEAARDLAEVWWEMPLINEGQGGRGPNGAANTVNPRIQSMIGMLLWALDTNTESTVFPGVESITEFYETTRMRSTSNYCMGDAREAWYVVMWASLLREIDTDPTRVANYEAMLTAAMDASGGITGGDVDPEICRHPTGMFHGYGAEDGNIYGASTVSVVNGSDEATCATPGACNWTASEVGKWFQVGVLNNRDRITDIGQYLITSQDSSKITFVPAFSGTTGSGRFYFMRPVNTYTFQALGNAMPLIALDWQYRGGFSDHRQAIVEVYDGVIANNYRSDLKALYSLTDYQAGCTEAILTNTSNTVNNCQFSTSQTASGQRFLTGEIVGLMTRGVHYGRQVDNANTAARIAQVDLMVGAAFGGLGGPGSDNAWATEFDDTGCTFVNPGCGGGNGKQKNFGFCCGVGGVGMWDAERLGGLAAEDLSDFFAPLNIAGVSGATKATCTLYEPRGFSRVVNNQTGLACTVVGDARQGGHLAKIEYKNAMDTVLQTDYVMAELSVEGGNGTRTQGTFTPVGSFTIQ